MVKSSIVKKFVTLGVAGAMAISVLGASVASATYYVDGGIWNTYTAGCCYGYSSYYHPSRYHTVSLCVGGRIFKNGACAGRWATISKSFPGNVYQVNTYYNVY